MDTLLSVLTYIPVVGVVLAVLGLVLMQTAPQVALGLVYGSPASAGFGEYAAQITRGHPVLIYTRLYVDLWLTYVGGGLIWLCSGCHAVHLPLRQAPRWLRGVRPWQ